MHTVYTRSTWQWPQRKTVRRESGGEVSHYDGDGERESKPWAARRSKRERLQASRVRGGRQSSRSKTLAQQ